LWKGSCAMIGHVRGLVGLPIATRARGLARSFLEQTARADEVQRALLLTRIARHARSGFGRDHHFGEIRSAAAFPTPVPIRASRAGGPARGRGGDEPSSARVRAGELDALFGPGTDVLMFAMTSGTTNRPKTIPVTREALTDYREGWTIWGILSFDKHFDRLRR